MDNCVITPNKSSRDAYAAYAYCLRKLFEELKAKSTEAYERGEAHASEVLDILDRYHVTPFEADGVLRLGVEFPKDVVKEFQEYWTARGGIV